MKWVILTVLKESMTDHVWYAFFVIFHLQTDEFRYTGEILTQQRERRNPPLTQRHGQQCHR